MGRQAPGSRLSDSLRTQLWPLPMLGVTVAVAAGVLLPRLDARIDDGLPASVTAYLFSGGAEAARGCCPRSPGRSSRSRR